METVFLILIVVMSVVIHEVAHGYAAYIQGDPTAKLEGRLTLNPISHLDPIGSILVPLITSLGGFTFGWAKPVPYNPYNLRNQRWGELLVALAGPASNFLIALVFGLIIRFGLMLPEAFLSISSVIIIVNLSLALFNLVPIPPLDGSKIVNAVLPYHLQQQWRSFERYSFIIILILLLTPQFSYLLGTLIGKIFMLMTGIS
jgi:Zn-dependent protease